jgi:hypothetical protein
MAGDDPVTALYFGRHLGVSQQLKFRGALSVKPHAHKIVQYGHATARQNVDKYENEFYLKNRQSALAFPTFFHIYPHRQSIALSLGPFTALGEGQKSTRSSSETRGRRRLGPLSAGANL